VIEISGVDGRIDGITVKELPSGIAKTLSGINTSENFSDGNTYLYKGNLNVMEKTSSIEIEVLIGSVPAIEADNGNGTGAELSAENEATDKAGIETDKEIETEAKTESEVDADSTNADTETETGTKAETETETETVAPTEINATEGGSSSTAKLNGIQGKSYKFILDMEATPCDETVFVQDLECMNAEGLVLKVQSSLDSMDILIKAKNESLNTCQRELVELNRQVGMTVRSPSKKNIRKAPPTRVKKATPKPLKPSYLDQANQAATIAAAVAIQNRAFIMFGLSSLYIYFRGDDLSV
jgi:hypothetical protein